jgi:hypothetical protein
LALDADAGLREVPSHSFDKTCGVQRPLPKWISHSRREAAIVSFEHKLTFDDES